ncbi:cytochrome c biogenesis CcdA family protein [Amphibacillus sp. Q70]|uniref:cytochrome c biogenesis CcdA family protein n=1 Tax=Amphibacillus sp. Q70 TaxID=3453416 RepID=UPI003F858107
MSLIETDTLLLTGIILALGAGALSFLSPCVLPIFPAYMSYITGISVKDLQGNHNLKIRSQLLSHSFFFLLGVSFVFISLGAGASFLGQALQKLLVGNTGLFIQRMAGVFIVIMGLFVIGWLKIPSLMKERRLHYTKKPAGFIGTFFVGLGFAAGWTPCIGPIFGSILLLATTQPGQGLFYTLFYIIGFVLPFITLTFFLGSTKWLAKHSGTIIKAGGLLMIVMGLVLFFGLMPRISLLLLDVIQDTWLSRLG